MSIDRSFVERNRAALTRLRELVARLSDDDLKCPVGEGWTVTVVLAHMAFWDRRVLAVLEDAEREGKVENIDIHLAVNDISLPLWAAIPPREAAWLAIASAQALDQKLEALSPELLEQAAAISDRTVIRAIHRADHINQIERALGK